MGELILSTVPALRRMVLAAAVLPISGVTVDLAGVSRLDRYAANELDALRRRVTDHSSIFALAAPSPPVRRALESAGIAQHFNYESVWSDYPSPTGYAAVDEVHCEGGSGAQRAG
jgi:anti-anti-sigma regulatory factor